MLAMRQDSTILLTIIAVSSMLLLEVVPHTIHHMSGFQAKSYKPGRLHNMVTLRGAESTFRSNVVAVATKVSKTGSMVRIKLGGLILSKSDAVSILKTMKSMDMDIVEYCKYSMLGIADAHSN